jgi:hypothetical protein
VTAHNDEDDVEVEVEVEVGSYLLLQVRRKASYILYPISYVLILSL